MKKKIDSPVDMLIAIVGRHKGNEAIEILNKYKIFTHVICIGNGTAESDIADLFGFGIIERDVVISLIPVIKSTKILNSLNRKFHFKERHNGLAFTIPINSIEKKILESMEVNKGEK
ncbi:MAG: hypothetical protein PHS54_02145 [Clostridia bacterium]|nr:hypothetical protein [Clostridia bacterium]